MKKIWKRSLSLFLAFVMVFGMLPVSTFADETEPVVTEETFAAEAVAAEVTETPAEEPTEPVTEAPVEETTVPVTEAPVEETTAPVTEAPVEITVMQSVSDEAVNSQEETMEETEPEEVLPEFHWLPAISCDTELPDNDALFAAYADHIWFGTDIATFGTTAGRQLNADTRKFYDALVPIMKDIASGDRTSCVVSIGANLYPSYPEYTPDVEISFNNDNLDLKALMHALLADLPYEMYWFDKVIGIIPAYSNVGTDYLYYIYFAVASNYNDDTYQTISFEDGSTLNLYYTISTDRINDVQKTTVNAQAVVDQFASCETDYDKLLAYKNWICDNTSYNKDVENNTLTFSENIDPWQLIYVFDGDPATEAVCEGYSKAFQFLCDLTFSKADPAEETVTCYSVTGSLVGVGDHMWNIVEIDDNCYLADITNSDQGSAGQDGSLFLVGGTADSNGVYTFSTLAKGGSSSFAYDQDTLDLWGDSGILTLSATNYEPPAEVVPGTMSQADFETALAKAAGGTYTLTSDVTLTKDMTLPCNVTVADGATLTIADGTTLTVAGYTLMVCSDLYIQEGGWMIVENNGWLYVPETDPADGSDNTDTEIIVDGKLLILAGGAIKTYGGPDVDTPPCVIVINGIMFVASNAASYDFCYDGSGLVIEGETDLDAKLVFYGCCNWGNGFRVDWEGFNTMMTMQPGDGRPGLFCIREWDAANYEFKQTVIDPDDLTVGDHLTVFTWADDPYCPGLDESDPYVNQIANIQAQEGAWDKQTSVSYTLNGTTYSFPIRLERPQTCAFYSEPTASNETYLGYNYTIDPDKSENSFYFIFTSKEDWTVVPGSFRVVDNPFDENSMADYVTWETISNTVYKITIKPDVVDALAASGDGLALHGMLEAKDSYGYTMTFGMGQIWCQTEQQDIYYDFHGFYTTSTASQETMLYDTLMLDPDAAENAFYYILTNPDFTVVDGTFQIMDNPVDRNPVEGVSYQKISDTVYKIIVSPEKVAELDTNGGYLPIFVELDAVSSTDGYTGSYSWGQLRCYVGGEMTQAEFAAALAANAGTNYVLTKSVTITEDMTISMATDAVPYNHSVKIPSGVTLTVANGATLTTETSLLVDDGTLVVENGSKLALGSDDRYSCLYLWGGTLAIAAQTGLDMSNGQIFMEHGQNCSLPGWLSLSRVTAQYYIRQQSALAELKNLDQYACADIYVQCDLVIDEDLALTHGENLYVHDPNSLTVSEGVTLTLGSNNMLYIGEGAAVNNNGTILCHGYFNNYGTLNGNAVEFGSSEMDEADLLAALNDSATSGTPYVLNQKVTLTAATVFPSGAQLHIVEGGRLTVSSGVHLTNLGDIQVNGGKFILLSGSAITSTGFITINSGIMFFANGVTYNIAGMNGPIIREAYGDTETQLVLYDFNDFGNGIITNWSHYRKSTIVTAPSMSVNGLPCIQEWDSENYEWIITPVDVADLTAGDYLTVQKWVGPTFSPDEPNADKYVSIRVADDAIGQTSYVSCNYNGTDYTLNFRFDIPENCAFYSEPAATAENYLGFRYSIDPSKSDNSFYFIFTKPGWSVVPGSFTVIDNPFDQNPVDHVTWTQLSDTIYRITVKPEAVEAFCATGGAFPVHCQVEATNPDGLRNVFGMGQLWCEAPLSEEAFRNAVAEAAENGEIYQLNSNVTLTSGMLITSEVHVMPGATLTVPSGVTLTVQIQNTGHLVVNGGTVVIEDGANLVVDAGLMQVWPNGTLTVADGANVSIINLGRIGKTVGYDGDDLNVTLTGIRDSLLTANYHPVNTQQIVEAYNSLGTYASVGTWLDADIVLDQNVTIPADCQMVLEYGEDRTLTIPDKITLTNNGNLFVQSGALLDVQEGAALKNNCNLIVSTEGRAVISKGATLVNNQYIYVDPYAQLVVRGTFNDYGTVDGEITWGEMSHEDLMEALENCENNGSSWVHESETTLDPEVNEGVLQIAMGEGPAFYLDDGGVIRVPSGTTLKVFNPLILIGGKVIVEAGGTLDAGDGHMEIREGTVYVEQGAEVIDNGHIQGRITWEGETDPWLSETWLDNWEEGWFLNPDNEIHEAGGLHVMDNHWRIYFLNTWDAENLQWNRVPVIPTENSAYMTITRIMDMEDHYIREDQEYAEYFVCVDVSGTLEYQNVNLFVNGTAYPYELYQRTVAFYSEPTVSMDTIITDGFHSMSGETDEEAVYWLVKEPEHFDVLAFSWNLETWGEDYTQYTGGDPLVVLDDSQAEQGIYKFVIDPDYVEFTKFEWKNFNLQIHMELDDNRDGEDNINIEYWDRDLWIEPAPQAQPQAYLNIDNSTYLVYEKGAIFRDFPTGEYDEEGNEIWDREQCSLPNGVAYELENNKLYLTGGAHLERLELAFMDCWEDEDGYHEEQRLPSADLELVVYGDNFIANDSSFTMMIRNGTNVHISGTGTLSLYAENSPYNYNEEGNRYAYPTVAMSDGSTLTIGGSVQVTAEVAGSGFHGDNPAQMEAIDGQGNEALILKDSAVLTIVTPEGTRTLDESQENYGGARGILSVNIDINDNATLNADSIYLWGGVSFTQNGGTVNLKPLGEVFYNYNLEGYLLSNLGVYLEDAYSYFTMNSGTLNIDAELDDNDYGYVRTVFDGINARLGHVTINGGEININGNSCEMGCGIEIQCNWTEDGYPDYTSPASSLTISGGVLNIYGPAEQFEGIYVAPAANAAFSGGAVYASGGMHSFAGPIDWTGDMELTGEAYVFEGSTITVKDGAHLIINDTFRVKEGGKIIVEDGGILDIQGRLYIEGTVYIRNGGDVSYGVNHYVEGQITREGDTNPYLSATWLDNRDNSGWYMNDEIYEENGLMTMEEHWRIFFLNTWDAENLVWNCEPVVPTENNAFMTITRLVDMEDQYIREDQEYAEYFVHVEVSGTLDSQDVTLSAKGYTFPFQVHGRNTGFFRNTEFSMDSIIQGHEFILDTTAADNSIYWLVRDPENYDVLRWEYNAMPWGGEDFSEYTGGDELVTATELGNGIYKFTIDPDFVDHVQYDWKNFELQVNMVLDYNGDDEIHEEHNNYGMWINPPELLQPAAVFGINNETYLFYDTGKVFRDCFAGFDQEGHEIWKREPSELKLSYIPAENRLILDTVDLTTLSIHYGYSWTDENGNEIFEQHLPNENLTITLVGSSSIINHCGPAVRISNGTNVTINGNGSLYAKTTNYPDFREENGNHQCYDTINVHDGSSLTIGGNVTITAEVDGHGYRENDEAATNHAFSGSHQGDTLVITDNATVTTVVPNGVRHYDVTGATSQIGGYVGIENFNTITVSGGELNTDYLNFHDGGEFNLTGGVVNLRDIGCMEPHWQTGETVYHYEGIRTYGGSVSISGGELNIDVSPRDGESADQTNVYGINAISGAIDISGGIININTGISDGWAILADCDWTQDGWIDGTESYFSITGGTINILSDPRTYHGGILISEICGGYFGGGEINDDYGVHRFYGNTVWGDGENGGGTVLKGVATNVYTHGPGEFYMFDGQMDLIGDVFEENGETVTNRAIFEANGSGTLFGGKINLVNGSYRNNMEIWLNGAEITINNDVADLPGLENYLYFPIYSGSLNITANGPAIINNGTFHQMGGEVYAESTLGTRPVMISTGRTLLNAGSLNLQGHGGVGLVQAYDFDLAADDIKNNESSLFMGAMDENQPCLNISGTQVGLYLNGPAVIVDGANVDIQVEGTPINADRDWPMAIYVEKHTGNLDLSGNNVSGLIISGGANVNLVSRDTAGVDAMSKGIVAWYSPVVIQGETADDVPNVTIDAEMAVYSISDSLENTNFNEAIAFFDENGAAVSLTSRDFTETEEAGDYLHTLMDGDSYVGYATIGRSNAMSLDEFLAAVAEAAANNAYYMLTRNVVVDRDAELPGGVMIADGAKLTVRSGAVLTNTMEIQVWKEGTLTVEAGGRLVNKGALNTEGTIRISDNGDYAGYVHDTETMKVGIYADGTVLPSVTGIPENVSFLQAECATEDQVNYILGICGGYFETQIRLTENMVLHTMTIPQNVWLNTLPDLTITVAEGAFVTVNGGLNTRNSDLIINGKLISNSDMSFNLSEITVNGTFDNFAPTFINDGSVMTVNGTFNNYAPLHVGFWKDAETAGLAGTLTINGTFNNYDYLNISPDAYIETEDRYCGGIVNVNEGGLLNNTFHQEKKLYGFIELHGELNIHGTLMNGQQIVQYGSLHVNGNVDNSGSIRLFDKDFETGNDLELVTYEGAEIINNTMIGNLSTNGVIVLAPDTYIQGSTNYDDGTSEPGELDARCFDDLTMSRIEGAPEGTVSIFYEGSNADALLAAAELYKANRNAYDRCFLRVVGDMTIPEGMNLNLIPGSYLVVLNNSSNYTGSLTVEGQIFNQGYIRLFGADMTIPQSGWITNKGIIDAGTMTYTERNEDGTEKVITLKPTVTVGGLLENASTAKLDLANATFVLAEGGVMQNNLAGDNLGNMIGVEISDQTLFSDIDSGDQAQLQQLIDKVQNDGYRHGCFWISSDLFILSNTVIPDNITLYIRPGVSLTNIDPGVILENNGRIIVEAGGQLDTNGNLYVKQEGIVDVYGSMTINAYGYVGLDANASLNVMNGGTLTVNGYFEVGEGTLNVAGGTVNNYGTTVVSYPNGTVNGNVSRLILYMPINDAVDVEAKIQALQAYAQSNGYAKTQVHFLCDYTFEAGFTVPQNMNLIIGAYGGEDRYTAATVTIPVNQTLTINGNVQVAQKSALILEDGANLVCNGSIYAFGSCGTNATWVLSNDVLTISGSGDMLDYAEYSAPWAGCASLIKTVKISTGITGIGAHAFDNISVDTILVPRAVNSVGEHAFASGVTLKVYHETAADTYAKNNGNTVIYIHELDPETGACLYGDFGLEATLKDETKTTEEKVEEVKNTDTESLKTQIEQEIAQNTDGNSNTMDLIENLEKELLQDETTDLTVSAGVAENTDEVITTVFENVSNEAIVGAALNAAENVSEVKLVISNPSGQNEVSEEYDTDTGVLFSMTLEGVEDASTLDIPVKITLPVPAGINDLSKLAVLHYHDGEEEVLTSQVFQENDAWYVTFVVDGFSDFAIVEKTNVTYECRLAAIEVSCEAEVVLRLKTFIPEELLADDNAYALLTKNGSETIITAAEMKADGVDSGGRHVLEVGIASGEMTQIVTLQIVDGNGNYAKIVDYADGSVGTTVSRSVLDYAKLALERGSAAQKKLITALLTYGGYAQAFFDVDTQNPAYNLLLNYSISIPTLEDITADSINQALIKSTNSIGITQTAQQAYLDSAIYHRIYFVLDAGASIENYTFTLTSPDGIFELEPTYQAERSRYYVDILDIPAAYWDYMYTVTVTNNSTGATYQVSTSVMAYVKLVLHNSNNEEQKKLAKAMYFYNQAANDFFGC